MPSPLYYPRTFIPYISRRFTMAFTIWSISWSADGDSIFEDLDLLRGLSSRVIMNFQHLEGTRLVQECGVVNGLKTLVHIGIWFRNPCGATKTLGNTVATGYATLYVKNSVWYGVLSWNLITGNRWSWQRLLMKNTLRTSWIRPKTCSTSWIQPAVWSDFNTALELGLARFRGPTVTSHARYSKLFIGHTRMQSWNIAIPNAVNWLLFSQTRLESPGSELTWDISSCKRVTNSPAGVLLCVWGFC